MLDNNNFDADSKYYNLHGFARLKITGFNDPVAAGLDSELEHFRVKDSEWDLSIAFGSYPSADWTPAGSSIDKRLFYHRTSSEFETLVLWRTEGRVSKEDARFVFVGDMKKSEGKFSAFIPANWLMRRKKPKYWRKIPHELFSRNWAKAALLALRRESLYPFEVYDDMTNEVLMMIVQPYLYYRLPFEGCSLVHGSSVASDNSGIIFFGTSNVGKTSLALQMVQQGLTFFGDDLVIVDSSGRGYSFPKRVRVEPQDTFRYPKLVPMIRAKMDGRERFVFDTMRTVSGKPPSVNVRLSVGDLYEGAKVGNSFQLRTLVHVRRVIEGEAQVTELEKEECINLIVSELFWQFNTGGKNEYPSVPSFTSGEFVEREVDHHSKTMNIIGRAITGAKAFELQLPMRFDPTMIGTMLSKIVSSS